jgi:D-lyxose ketol-isomerase
MGFQANPGCIRFLKTKTGKSESGCSSKNMQRSTINRLIRSAETCYRAHGWALPPNGRWDVTDFGLGNWRKFGLVLVTLAAEPEHCEKLMYAQKEMTTPAHCHRKKKEDTRAIISS